MAGLVGAVLGAITQSASVVAFILSGMVSTGLLPISRALIVLACANIGTALLVFIAASDLHVSILFLIGITGLILAFKLVKTLEARGRQRNVGRVALPGPGNDEAGFPAAGVVSAVRTRRGFLAQGGPTPHFCWAC
jgi:hypothetical protein